MDLDDSKLFKSSLSINFTPEPFPEKKLPIYQPNMVKFQLVDSTVQHIKRFHKIADYKLINQNNKIITNKIYDGKIYIADFFFTTCPGICPIMTDNMIKLQEKFINDDQVLLLSHTVTPEIDSVSVLKKYSMEKGVVDSKWNMVTGLPDVPRGAAAGAEEAVRRCDSSVGGA